MIWNVMQIHFRRLRHNRMEWLLTFVVPIAFFSIFALIFSRGMGSTPRVKVVLVGDVATTATPQAVSQRSARVLELLEASEGLRVINTLRPDRDAATARRQAETLVRRGAATIAIVLQSDDQSLSVQLLNDASDQVASQVVTALVTRAMIQSQLGPLGGESQSATAATPDQASQFAQFVNNFQSKPSEEAVSGGTDPPLAAQSREEEANFTPATAGLSATAAPRTFRPASIKPPNIEVVNVMGQSKSNPVVSVYAAGIAVMFLLFGATSGGGVLLEERENQTLERLLSTQMTMDHLLLGKWFYLTLLGTVQVTVMFVWAQLVFGLDLLGHFDGFLMMTIVTSAAAASFGLFLATLCQTRGQLNGLSVILVLTMSALGGSMVPRYVMSEKLREMGLWTFNAWALDGYDKVFWRELPPSELGPQLGVLMATAFGLLLMSRLLAIRWEFS